jgi:hypothetical protein
VNVLADTPAMAMASLYQALAQAAGLATQNAVVRQQSAHDIALAATTRCVSALAGERVHGG